MSAQQGSDDAILRFVKFHEPQTADAIARHLGVSVPGARKHLLAMTTGGLLAHFDEAAGVGRPRRYWSLTDAAQSRFSDTHALLTVELIASVRAVFGREGLDQLIGERERITLARYGSAMEGARDLDERIDRLVELRSAEGYMAHWSRGDNGEFLLVENHCPICAAARACQNFCRSELEMFRAVLGDGVQVERAEHILGGSRRCAYRIRQEPRS